MFQTPTIPHAIYICEERLKSIVFLIFQTQIRDHFNKIVENEAPGTSVSTPQHE
jgi:hypothetical protein